MKYIEGQILYLNALIMAKHATIISGAYKSRKVYHGIGMKPENIFTEEELLQDELQAMHRQIDWLNDAIALLPQK